MIYRISLYISMQSKDATVLRGVVTPCYQHQLLVGGVDNKMPQLHATQSKPLD